MSFTYIIIGKYINKIMLKSLPPNCAFLTWSITEEAAKHTNVILPAKLMTHNKCTITTRVGVPWVLYAEIVLNRPHIVLNM